MMNITITPTAAQVKPLPPSLPCIEEAYALLVLDRERLKIALANCMYMLESVQAQVEDDPMAMPWPSIEEARAVLASINHQ